MMTWHVNESTRLPVSACFVFFSLSLFFFLLCFISFFCLSLPILLVPLRLHAHPPLSSSPSAFLLHFLFAMCSLLSVFSSGTSVHSLLYVPPCSSLLSLSFSLSFQLIPPPLIPHSHLRIPPYTPIASLCC